jgi:hypothetical protein
LSSRAAAVAVVLAAAAAQAASAQARVLALPLERTTQSPLAVVAMALQPQRADRPVLTRYLARLLPLAAVVVDQMLPPRQTELEVTAVLVAALEMTH